jgi:hypothetical protein
MPSILTIRTAKANLAFVRFVVCDGLSPVSLVPRKVIGMGYHSPACTGRLCRRQTRVLCILAVYVSIGTVWTSYPDDGRNTIQDVSKFLLCPLLFVNIEMDPNPKQYGSVRSSDRLGSTEKPPVSTFSITNSKYYLSRATGAKAGRPDSACLFLVVRMQEGDVGIPFCVKHGPETKRMVMRQPAVIRIVGIHES